MISILFHDKLGANIIKSCSFIFNHEKDKKNIRITLRNYIQETIQNTYGHVRIYKNKNNAHEY